MKKFQNQPPDKHEFYTKSWVFRGLGGCFLTFFVKSRKITPYKNPKKVVKNRRKKREDNRLCRKKTRFLHEKNTPFFGFFDENRKKAHVPFCRMTISASFWPKTGKSTWKLAKNRKNRPKIGFSWKKSDPGCVFSCNAIFDVWKKPKWKNHMKTDEKEVKSKSHSKTDTKNRKARIFQKNVVKYEYKTDTFWKSRNFWQFWPRGFSKNGVFGVFLEKITGFWPISQKNLYYFLAVFWKNAKKHDF